MIEARELRKSFGRVEAVRGVTFTAPDAAITGLLGANGAGKSTTLAMLCGLIRPDRGSVEIDGHAGDARDRRRSIGALLDHQGLYPRLTARENLEYFAHLHGLPPAALGVRVDQLVQQFGLEKVIDRRASGFSQGERLRVALARAVVHQPRHVLLDEPTNGLDVAAVRNLRRLLRQMRDDGCCVLFSSHVLDEVRTLCDRVVVIGSGRVVSEGSVEAVLAETGTATLEDAFINLVADEAPACA